MMKFLKGLFFGMVAGLTAGLMVTPHAKRKVMRSQPCRKLRGICHAVEDMF